MAQRQEHVPKMSETATRAALGRILEREALKAVFQPILELQTGRLVGRESLARVTDPESPFKNTGELFEAAERTGMLGALERLARRRALEAAAGWPETELLFLNSSPASVVEDGFVEELDDQVAELTRRPPRLVVLEITERADDALIEQLRAKTMRLAELGYPLAIDDVGAGSSGLNRIMSLRPGWLKLDRELISEIDADPFKQNLIRFFVRFARLSNMNLVAEGIENERELGTLIDLGVSHGQGFLLARPGDADQSVDPGIVLRIVSLARHAEARRVHDITTIRMGDLVVPAVVCDQVEPVADVCRRVLGEHMHPAGAVVLDGRRYLGWVGFDRLGAIVAEGRGHIPISAAGLIAVPQLGADVTLAEALEIAGSRPDGQMALPIVVESAGRVAGVVGLRKLLLSASDAHRRAPSHIAPLTGLPSRVQADRWLMERIAAGDPAHLVFIDLRDFDAYNRAYGFEMGDLMLRELVELIQDRLAGDEAAIFAHLGEDRFMLAFDGDVRPRLASMIEAFQDVCSRLFSPAEVEAGSFSYLDGLGRTETAPLTSVRAVYLPAVLQRVREPRDVYQLASQLRMRQVAPGPGGVIITDRRADEASARASA